MVALCSAHTSEKKRGKKVNIEYLTPVNKHEGFSPELGKVVTIITSVDLPSMLEIRENRQSRPPTKGWCINKGLRLRIDSLLALGMTDLEIKQALEE